MPDYFRYRFLLSPNDEAGREILLAELTDFPFETLEETDLGVDAYIQESEAEGMSGFDFSMTKSAGYTVDWSHEKIATENWNETWEKAFHPIEVDNLYIRAPFHLPHPTLDFEIVIEPKMSFGTGHHQTTRLVSSYLLQNPPKGMDVLDMGCGTGILAILAAKLGAKKVHGIDIDEWAYLNARENCDKNDCPHITLQQGGAELLGAEKYDLILANINRNILLADMATYISVLKPGGRLVMSGFYSEDIPILELEAAKYNLVAQGTDTLENWARLTVSEV